MLARGRCTAKDIVKLTKFPKATIYHVFKRFKEDSKVDRKEHKTQSDSKRALPGFMLTSNARLKPTYQHPRQFFLRNAMGPFPQCLELSTGTLA